VLKVEGMSKRYGDQVVLDDVHLSVLRGERIGIIGKNGAGKTTLLRMLAGEAPPDTGAIHYGHHVEVGYYAQHHRETLAANRTVFDQVAGQANGHSPTSIRTLLGTLGLCGDDVDKPVGVLSGGERARVALARLLITSCNLVFMDEPTNHLDLQSSERLAEALASFDGALVFASHNKSFVRRLATRIWNVADQKVEIFPGSLDEYLTSVLRRLELPEESDSQSQDAGQTPMAVSKGHGRAAAKERKRREAAERTRRRQVVGPLVQRVAELERRIEDLEAVQRERHEKLADPAFYDDAQKSAELSRQYQQDASLIEQLTSEWEIAETERQRAVEALDATLRREQGTG
jgi:ATP-binding cassette subfamily F protein 3